MPKSVCVFRTKSGPSLGVVTTKSSNTGILLGRQDILHLLFEFEPADYCLVGMAFGFSQRNSNFACFAIATLPEQGPRHARF